MPDRTVNATADLPVVVIGAGPIGLAAAAHLVVRGERPLILEAGTTAAAGIRDWAHVRLFTPWKLLTDAVTRRLLEEHGWSLPDQEIIPTGGEFVQRFIQPLAEHPAIAPCLRFGRRVTRVSRAVGDQAGAAERGRTPFEVLARTQSGSTARYLARAVIDASGTYATPNGLGPNGLPAEGERELRDVMYYGIPDVLGRDRERYAGRRSLIVGSGHSAFNAVADLAELAREAPGTEVLWAVRRASSGLLFGEKTDDLLPARQGVVERARNLVLSDRVKLLTGFQTERLTRANGRIAVEGTEGRTIGSVDQVIVTTGYHPDLQMLGDIRLALDSALEVPVRLAPLIDPQVHTCGTVPLHGYEELQQPEPNFFIVGMKSYGRAPTFLLVTGYEQVRSVVAAVTGDVSAAKDAHSSVADSGTGTPKGISGACCSGVSQPAAISASGGFASACAPGAAAPPRTRPSVRSSTGVSRSCCD